MKRNLSNRNIIIYVKEIVRKDPNASDFPLKERGLYIGNKTPFGPSGKMMYHIFAEEVNDPVKSDFFVVGKKSENPYFYLEIEEISIEDALMLDLSQGEIDKLNAYQDGFYDSENEYVDDSTDVFDENIEIVKTLKKDYMPKDNRAQEIADGIELDYIKFQLHEIRERNPEMFVSLINMITQIKNNI